MDIRAAIRQAAIAQGIPPEYALATAERESSFRPNARASKTIAGLFQFTGKNRRALNLADDAGVDEQVRALADHSRAIRQQMGDALGRDPSNAETYLGHHFGAGRAAQILMSDPSTPVSAWFTPEEMDANPHFGKAGTVGKLVGSISSDMDRRMDKYSEAPLDFAKFGAPIDTAAKADFSKFGTPVPPDDGSAVMASFGVPAPAPQQTAPNQVADTYPVVPAL
jgi:hypothetical protein